MYFIMSNTGNFQTIETIQNPICFSKYALYYLVPCATAMVQVYQWLFNGSTSPEDIKKNLNIIATGDKKLKFKLNQTQELQIKAMNQDGSKMKGLDTSLLYKLVRYGTFSDNLAKPYEDVWGDKCPEEKFDCLEYKLTQVYTNRNNVFHPDEKLKNLTEEQVRKECEFLTHQLTSIIKLAAKKASDSKNITDADIKNVCDCIKNELERIRDGQELVLANKEIVLSLIHEDLKNNYENSFLLNQNEFKNYISQKFMNREDFKGTTDNFLSTINSPIVIISGETGMGKTFLTKYLLSDWMSKDEFQVKDLVNFDVLICMRCQNNKSSDIPQLLERQLPISYQYFSNESTLKTHLKDFKVLWVMDGFDECSSACKGFLKSLMTDLSPEHKVVITSRPACVYDLSSFIDVKVDPFVLMPFSTNDVKMISEDYFDDASKSLEFLSFFDSLNDEEKELLQVPVNLKICLKVWENKSKYPSGTLTVKMIYKKILEHQIELLFIRHRKKTFESSCLKLDVEKWFYDYLCKTASESVSEDLELSDDEQDYLEEGARDEGLLESYCLSSFFVIKDSADENIIYCYKNRLQKEILSQLYCTREKSLTNGAQISTVA